MRLFFHCICSASFIKNNKDCDCFFVFVCWTEARVTSIYQKLAPSCYTEKKKMVWTLCFGLTRSISVSSWQRSLTWMWRVSWHHITKLLGTSRGMFSTPPHGQHVWKSSTGKPTSACGPCTEVRPLRIRTRGFHSLSILINLLFIIIIYFI